MNIGFGFFCVIELIFGQTRFLWFCITDCFISSLHLFLSFIHTHNTNIQWLLHDWKWETDYHSILLFIWFQSQIGRHLGSSTMYGQSMLTNMVSVHVLHTVIPWVISAMLIMYFQCLVCDLLEDMILHLCKVKNILYITLKTP